MVGIILATHGDFAKGILQSGSMIFGDQPNVAACTLQPSMGPEDIKNQMEDAIAGFENQDEVLIMVDLWGGTPFNQANGLIAGHEDTWAIVAGLNLPMLIYRIFSILDKKDVALFGSTTSLFFVLSCFLFGQLLLTVPAFLFCSRQCIQSSSIS